MAEFEKVLAISPGNTNGIAELGYAYAVAGRRAEAQKVLDQLSDSRSKSMFQRGSVP